MIANKYVQGSVWRWKNDRELKPGVQGGERPVLIISNDKLNETSVAVNCVTITTVIKHSPVHVSAHIDADSEIQCEQIHTISKTELIEFKGMVPPDILAQVKAKLRFQLDMYPDMRNSMKIRRRKFKARR